MLTKNLGQKRLKDKQVNYKLREAVSSNNVYRRMPTNRMIYAVSMVIRNKRGHSVN
jgi:hypothetical protein